MNAPAGILSILVPATYWVIVVLWSVILFVFLRKIRGLRRMDRSLGILTVVLAADAFRTVFENLYFGTYFTSGYGYLPDSLHTLLGRPLLLATPKLFNVAVGCLVLFLLIRRWFPRAAEEREEWLRSLDASLQETRRLRDRYRTIIDASPDLICAIDAQGRFSDVGARCQDILGHAPQALLGQPFEQLVHADDLSVVQVDLDRVRRGAQVTTPVCRFLHRDGHAVKMIWTFAASSAEATVYAVGRDQSVQLAMQDHLQQNQRLESLGQLTGGIAHDFNNLLTVILGNAELLLEELRHQPQVAELAQMVRTAGERGADLTRRILAFARRQPLEPAAIDVTARVDALQTMMRHLLGGEPTQVRIERPGTPLYALVDGTALESAVINLCLNARDAMPHGGTLTVRVEAVDCSLGAPRSERSPPPDLRPGHYVAVSVADGGEGIPASHLPRVFEPFFTTKPRGKGTGLGLAMVYGFVRQSGGDVTIASAAGQGTRVCLYLPQAPVRVPAEPDSQRSVAQAPPRGRETIVLVEDDELVRQFAGGELRKLGYHVVDVPDEATALALIEQDPAVQLLFAALSPRGVGGQALASAAQHRRPELKMLFASAQVDVATLAGAGGAQLIAKPYRADVLALRIRAILDAEVSTV